MNSKERSASSPAREKQYVSATRPVNSRALVAIRRPFLLVIEALREIFDETAYQRFLIRSGLQTSAASYAVFREEDEQAKSRKPRCC